MGQGRKSWGAGGIWAKGEIQQVAMSPKESAKGHRGANAGRGDLDETKVCTSRKTGTPL